MKFPQTSAKSIVTHINFFFWTLIGAFLFAFGIEVFLIPNNLIDGGVVGIAMIVGNLFGKSLIPYVLMLLNVPFIILAYRYISKIFVVHMLIAVVLFAASMVFIQHVMPWHFDGESLEVVVIGGAILGVGLGLIIRMGGCLDGTEILGIIMNQKFGLTVGQVVLFCNVFVFGSAGIVFQDWHPPLLSLIMYMVVIKVMDSVIVGLDETKSVIIISRKSKEMANDIMHQLGLGLTILYGRGGFSGKDQEILYVIAERLQLADLKELVYKIDPTAFIAIENLHEVANGRQSKGFAAKNPVATIVKKVFTWKKPEKDMITFEEIRAQAIELGWDDVGITEASISQENIDSYQEWISTSFHADLQYMSNELRCYPERLLPGAKTALIFVSNYKQEKVPFRTDAGVIASYARGRKYHNIHHRRLKKMIAWLETKTGLRGIAKGFSDSTPVLEKALAVQAGLGWFGKNTLLIHRKFGTFTLLSGLFTTLEIAGTVMSPRLPRCGSCTRCLDACPTQALVSPYRLDAARCLSYHLIESQKEIPEKIREQNPGYIFGCDACQDSCPHNVRSPLSLLEEFASESGNGPYLTLEHLREVEKKPEKLFGTPLQRTGLERLRANFLQLAK